MAIIHAKKESEETVCAGDVGLDERQKYRLCKMGVNVTWQCDRGQADICEAQGRACFRIK